MANQSFSVSYTRDLALKPEDFVAWTAGNHYRTSSLDMSYKAPCPSKTYAIPGYAGHIPGSSDTHVEKGFTVTTREQLTRDKYLPARTIDVFPNRPNNSERTLGRFGGGLEDEYHTISRFHGKTTIPATHPNIQDNVWLTTSSFSYKNPETHRKEIFYKTNYNPIKSAKVSKRPKTFASGFVQNSTLFDGNGWLPIKKLHGDMKTSEYRHRFNPTVNFHPKPHKPNTRALKKKELVY